MNKSVLILFAIISTIDCQEFCDEQHSQQLFDTIFSFNESVYAFRRPNSFWILTFDQNSGLWTQTMGPIKKGQLFDGMADDQPFDSILSIPKYTPCDPSKCYNSDPDFDPTNITFVFEGNHYFLYERKTQNSFGGIGNGSKKIPWAAERSADKRIADIFPDVLTRMYGSVVISKQSDLQPETVVLLTEENILEFNITDVLETLKVRQKLNQSLRFVIKNGGISHQKRHYFFINGVVVEYVELNTGLKTTSHSYWDFFSCGHKSNPSLKTKNYNQLIKRAVRVKPFHTFPTVVVNSLATDLLDIKTESENIVSDSNVRLFGKNYTIDGLTSEDSTEFSSDVSSKISSEDTPDLKKSSEDKLRPLHRFPTIILNSSTTDSLDTTITSEDMVRNYSTDRLRSEDSPEVSSEDMTDVTKISEKSVIKTDKADHKRDKRKHSFLNVSVIYFISVLLATVLVICLVVFGHKILSKEL